MNVSIRNTIAFALALALAQLQNNCVDQSDNSDLTYVSNGEWLHELNGAAPLITAQDLQSTDNNDAIPVQLLNGRHHFDDIGVINGRYNRQGRYNYIIRVTRSPLVLALTH